MRDAELTGLLRQRDQRGLDELHLHYGPLMRYIIAPILSDPREQEECLSDISLRVWEKIDQFDPERGSLINWLSALTRNTALNRARRAGRDNLEQELAPDIPSPAAGPEETLLRQERAQALRKALDTLSIRDRALFYRKYYYMQPTAQIAAELGMTERAVEGRLYRMKKLLRQRLGGEDHD